MIRPRDVDAPEGEALIYDAHLPSMTARFRIPEGLPLASGVYRLEYLRPPTADDRERWSHLPTPVDESELVEALEVVRDALRVNSITTAMQVLNSAIAKVNKADGDDA